MIESQSEQYNYFPYGEALVDAGLVVGYGTNGVGLVTRGLVWQGYDIYGPAMEYASTNSWADSNAAISTSWANSNAVVTTSWAASNSSITTTWADSSSASSTSWSYSRFGPYGEFPP